MASRSSTCEVYRGRKVAFHSIMPWPVVALLSWMQSLCSALTSLALREPAAPVKEVCSMMCARPRGSAIALDRRTSAALT